VPAVDSPGSEGAQPRWFPGRPGAGMFAVSKPPEMIHAAGCDRRSGSTLDRIGKLLARRGERIAWLTLAVTDLDRTRTRLVERSIPFTQRGTQSLFLEEETMYGGPIELSTP